MAKALGRGLHAGGGAVSPKEFRRSHGPCALGAGVAPAAWGAPAQAPAPAPAPAPELAPAAPSRPPPSTGTARPADRTLAAAAYPCDGRTYCSQMTSCEEATFFLRHCPGVKMDGNHDGVPCEKQWCKR